MHQGSRPVEETQAVQRQQADDGAQRLVSGQQVQDSHGCQHCADVQLLRAHSEHAPVRRPSQRAQARRQRHLEYADVAATGDEQHQVRAQTEELVRRQAEAHRTCGDSEEHREQA